ncbi:uncharacterized protein LAJ45_11606 [Morchella importuna]|uniref:uncharacterized protein n=1 Tax=Morchella importuna TaxID=1174673 RepID=UPI001E8CB1B5|nr:uncharacterized protein LAJ45_11606 [Morchella importuna]KAH8144406.1 hypothetical protein LAJ45_11606 [Morchella importuna]
MMELPLNPELPVVDHSRRYSKYECLMFALSHYYAELREGKTPVVSRIAKLYGVSEATLRRHIKKPNHKTLEEIHQDQQLLTPAEEEALVERLLFLDDFCVPADRTLFYSLANNLLRRRKTTNPDETLPTLGKNWIYRFLGRHPECPYVLTKTIGTNRANAYSWDVMDDFFWKLRKAIEKYEIGPKNTYNLDEKGFIMGIGDITKEICRNVRKDHVLKSIGYEKLVQ